MASKKASSVNIDHAPVNVIPTTQIVADHDQNVRAEKPPRESVKGLAQNIKANGLLQSLVVVPMGGKDTGKYRLIAGFRRYEAIKEHLKWSTIPCKLVPLEAEADILAASWSENEQRAEMTPFEKARVAGRLNQEFGLSGSQIATRMGVGKSYINNLTRIAREVLPEILDAWRERGLRRTADGKLVSDPVLTMPAMYELAGITRHRVENKGKKDEKHIPLTGEAAKRATAAQLALFKGLQECGGDVKKARKWAADNSGAFSDVEKEREALRKPKQETASGGDAASGEDAASGGDAANNGKKEKAPKRLSGDEIARLQDLVNKAGNDGKLDKVNAFELATEILDAVRDRNKVIKMGPKGSILYWDAILKPAPKAENAKGDKANATA